MIYEYRCDKNGEVIEKNFPMNGEIPVEIVEGKKVYKRIFGNQSIHIPFQWGQESGINFNKSPSRKKHVY